MDKHLALKYMKSPIVLLERLPIKFENNSFANRSIKIVNARYNKENEIKREATRKMPNEEGKENLLCTNEIYETIKIDTVIETEQVKFEDNFDVVTDENVSSLVEGNGDECDISQFFKTDVNIDADECYDVDEGSSNILLVCQGSPSQINIDDNKDYYLSTNQNQNDTVDSYTVGDATELMYVNDITIEDNDPLGSREEFNQAIDSYLSRIPETVDIADVSDPEVISLEDENFMTERSQNLMSSAINNEHNYTMTVLKQKLFRGRNELPGDPPENSTYKTLTESFAKFFQAYCFTCRSSFPKTAGRIEKNCPNCKSSRLRMRCISCKKDYAHCAGLIRHLIHSESCVPEENRSTIQTQYFYCPHCDYKAAKKWFLSQHMLKHTQPLLVEYYACSKCTKSFENKDLLKRHEEKCGAKPELTCSFCTFKTRHVSTLAIHMQRHVIGAPTDLSNQPTRTSSNNTNIASSGNSNIAECVKQLMNQEHADRVIQDCIQVYCHKCKRVTDETEYECRSCELSLMYKCRKCQYVKYEYGDLRLHVERTHLKRYQNCPRCTKSVLNLREHLSNCGTEARLFCKFCNFRTKYRYSLNNHIGYMHPATMPQKNTKPRDNFTCDYCTFTTQRKISLIRHIQLMHASAYMDVNFDCRKCGKDCRNVYVQHKHEAKCNIFLIDQ